MLPQHGGVPNFSLKIPGPLLLLLVLVLITGLMLTLSLYLNADKGDVAAQNQVHLSLIITIVASILVFIAGTGRWWHPHLWNRRSGRKKPHRHHRR